MQCFNALGITLAIMVGLFLFAVLLVPVEVIGNYFTPMVQVTVAVLAAAIYGLSLWWLNRRHRVA